MKFIEIANNRFKMSFVVKKNIKTSKKKPSSIIEHVRTGRINQQSSDRFSSEVSHELNVELQLYRQDSQILELT